jgi:hypothetical protein
MQHKEDGMGARLIKATENIIAATVRLFHWWFRQIGRQDTMRGKAIVAGVGLLALCVACSIPVALVNGPSKPAPAIAIAPTTKPPIAEADAPTSSPTAEPSSIPQPSPTSISPSSTPIPSPTAEPPTATAEPTMIPTAEPKPLAVAPTAKPASGPIPAAADVGAAPCQPGQIKGNRNSGIYHAPRQRDYAKTHANVACFDTEAEAIAAGYRKAKR